MQFRNRRLLTKKKIVAFQEMDRRRQRLFSFFIAGLRSQNGILYRFRYRLGTDQFGVELFHITLTIVSLAQEVFRADIILGSIIAIDFLFWNSY